MSKLETRDLNLEGLRSLWRLWEGVLPASSKLRWLSESPGL